MNMELETAALEDGELSCDSDSYTPLERPATYSAAFVDDNKVQSESDGKLSTSSASDSDSDPGCRQAKVAKMKTHRIVKQAVRRKPGKYDVWSNRAQEDSLLETLTSCDVSTKDRSRAVESYDNKSRKLLFANKRTSTQRKDAAMRIMSRKHNSPPATEEKGYPRMLLDVVSTPDKSDQDMGVQIANNLLESKEDLIVKVVTILGREKTLNIYNEVKRIEADGGMLIMNQTRRRTPGGVFLFLLKHDDDLTTEQRNAIFEDERKQYKTQVKEKKVHKSNMIKLQRDAADKLKTLPDITKAEFVQKLHNKTWSLSTDNDRTDNDDVVNPPPTPEADNGHNDPADSDSRQQEEKSYESDFLDVAASNVMDLF